VLSSGVVHVVDMEDIELSNLQRYVLAVRDDEKVRKVDVAARDGSQLQIVPHHCDLRGFFARKAHSWDEGRSIRDLYVEGFCGGVVLPPQEAGGLEADRRELHVPLAHQSALAGVLPAAALARKAHDGLPELTHATRLHVLDAIPEQTTQPVRALRDGRCLCDDPDYVRAYQHKYAAAESAD
jgi:hypothetical protein